MTTCVPLTFLAEVVSIEQEGDEHHEDGGAGQSDQHDRPQRQLVVVIVVVRLRVLLPQQPKQVTDAALIDDVIRKQRKTEL